MTTVSEVSICNWALSKLGAETITSLTQDSENARLCNTLYNIIRDNVLTGHIWNFAQKRAILAQLAEAPTYTDDLMTVKYTKPADCLKINFVNFPSAIVKIEEDGILSDTEGLKIKYTYRVTDPMKFFPKFVEALAARLAAEMAFPITRDKGIATTLFNLYYKEILPEAKSVDSQQGTPMSAKQDEWLDARIYGGGVIAGKSGDETWYPLGG